MKSFLIAFAVAALCATGAAAQSVPPSENTSSEASLAGGTDTAEASELADERLALLLGRAGELIGALSDDTSGALVGDRLDELERGLRPRDRERAIRAHTPRRFLASA